MAEVGNECRGQKMFILVLTAFLSTCSAFNVDKHHNHSPCTKVPKMTIDTALLTINAQGVSDKNINISLKAITTECNTCRLQIKTEMDVTKFNTCSVLMDTRWKMKLAISNSNLTILSTNCGVDKLSTWFKDQGKYTLFLNNVQNRISCREPILENDPMDSNVPIYVALGVFSFLALGWYILVKLHRANVWRRVVLYCTNSAADISNQDEFSTETDLGIPTNMAEGYVPRPASERLKSLDTFRGISIVLMIFVNYRGGDYYFFRHSKWNGITVADLVFPWFVWIMGTALAFSVKAQLRRSTPKTRMFRKILKRSCILFALGLLINSSDGLNPSRVKKFRIPGVLQRFAGTYLIIATLHMLTAKPYDSNEYSRWRVVRDITDYWVEWIVNLALVLLWLLLTFLLPVPGCPKGYLGPGGLAWDWNNKTNVSQCTGGAAMYIDHQIFGAANIYQHPSCKEIYKTTVAHDPEGLLGTLTSCFMCFLGLQAGKIMKGFPNWKERVVRFIIWGIALGVIALILCKGTKNDGFIPINKNLWSLSFVICLSSFAFFLFTFCYLTIDVYKVWSGAPFYYPGMNAIILYMLHEMINQPVRTFLGVHPTNHATYMAINVSDTAVWVLLAYFLHHHNIFITV